MSAETITWIWLGGGVALMLLEPVIPGLVALFIGAAAVLVGGLRWLGLVDDLGPSLAIWMALSVVLVLGVRRLLWKLEPAESRHDGSPEDEEKKALGAKVQVVVRCDAESTAGRVRFQGTTWPAQTVAGEIEAGHDARLVIRDNLVWLIEPWEDQELDARFEAELSQARRLQASREERADGETQPREEGER